MFRFVWKAYSSRKVNSLQPLRRELNDLRGGKCRIFVFFIFFNFFLSRLLIERKSVSLEIFGLPTQLFEGIFTGLNAVLSSARLLKLTNRRWYSDLST